MSMMENEKRLIDANALDEAIRTDYWEHFTQCHDTDQTALIDMVCEDIGNAPTVDAVEVVHGYWDDSGRYQFTSGKKAVRCSVCGCALSEGEYHLFNWNYCPVCGAKMDMEVDK